MSLNDLIKELRQATSAGVIDCKKALEEAKGDMKRALDLLRQKGAKLAAKKASRAARQGKVESYIHAQGKIGVLVEVNCETDFVAKNEEFQKFVKDVAMQIAAMDPKYIKKEEMHQDIPEEEARELHKHMCLLEQSFIKDQSMTINDYLASLIGKIGENIVIRRFTRYQLGE
ncbi:MAG: translation elongation factor Ts [Candidatus Omnitrophica bacterium CG11_big_fil_rev_8_21_14_0_20_42_13]|uniref:Elongation factor Ts n=1 Tax=Candidatus Ghiorseimicrobium undicola TaxID=1974746 RepID=A0A2H0LWM7_9BACT|nr:MAG: translation elongation factor Ts [Candidatus Omnitrophica bacterium CG11_big_fil_rev_8_21_14_0_20_42_13]